MLREAVRRFLTDHCQSQFVRRMMAHESAHDADFWQKICDLGWPALLVPEEFGGQGGTFLDLAVVSEEAGRFLMPGPFLTSATLGTVLMLEGARGERKRETLQKMASGKFIGTLALAEVAGRYDAEGIKMRTRVQGDKYVLSGDKFFVPDAHVANALAVVARTADGPDPEKGLTVFWVDTNAEGVAVTQLKTVDQTRRVCHVRFDNVVVGKDSILGEEHHGWPLARRALEVATAGICIELVGTAQRALDMAVEYAKTRVQFGRPIGSFQGVKHKCVDMMVALENARSLAYYACWAVDSRAPETPRAVAMAKATVSDMAQYVTSEAIQVHGGIGFTWEHDMHLFFRRAIAGGAAFGNPSFHREAVARIFESRASDR